MEGGDELVSVGDEPDGFVVISSGVPSYPFQRTVYRRPPSL